MRLLGAILKFQMKLFYTLGTNAVAEISYGMLDKIMLNRMPIVLIVSDALAMCTNRYQTSKGLKLHQIICQFSVLVPDALVHKNYFKLRLNQVAELQHELFCCF